MPVMAVRTYEPWTPFSVLAGILLLAVLVMVLILVVDRVNR